MGEPRSAVGSAGPSRGECAASATHGAHTFRPAALAGTIDAADTESSGLAKFDLAECETRAAELGRLWREYFESLPPSLLSQMISYKNTKGEPWTDTVQDILTHVLMHSAYHRGQIASQKRASGQTPAYTDFIHAVRQGLI